MTLSCLLLLSKPNSSGLCVWLHSCDWGFLVKAPFLFWATVCVAHVLILVVCLAETVPVGVSDGSNTTKSVVCDKSRHSTMCLIQRVMSDMAILGKRLKQLRLAAGLSQEQLGIEAGLDPASASARMNRYELGKRMPDTVTLDKLGEVLDAPPAYFHAVSDELAALVLGWHRLPKERQQQMLELMAELLENPSGQ